MVVMEDASFAMGVQDFGPKLFIFHTIFSMIRVHMYATKMSDFFKKLSICMGKHSEKGVG